jgi:hypothetical protein
VLLFLLLLPRGLRCAQTPPGALKGDESVLPLPSGSLCGPGHRSALLPQQHPVLHRALPVAVVSGQFGGRVLHMKPSQFGCVGPSAVYRMSLSILCLFTLMLLLMFCRSRLAMVVNEGLFCFKYLIVVGLFIGFLWI